MAKRKRKMTLFDVMAAGQPVGLNVKDRQTLSRPVPTSRDDRPNGRPSAAEELAALRRERERPAAVVEAPSRVDDRSIPLEPAPEFTVAKAPREPRTPISEHVRRAWAVAAPKVAGATRTATQGVRSVGRSTASLASAGWGQARRVRDIDTRYLWTGTVAAAGIALLVGAFYVGRLLFRGPSSTIIADANTTDVRSDVLDIHSRGGEASASPANRPADIRLERGRPAIPVTPPAPPAPASNVFGGRDLSLNYVVIETYNTPEDAAAAAEVLAQYKVRTTVEKNLPGWRAGNQDRYMVVGLDGFAKISTPDFKAYLSALDRISEREAGKTLPAKLQHGAYKWRAAN
jgi:hypothetical protein